MSEYVCPSYDEFVARLPGEARDALVARLGLRRNLSACFDLAAFIAATGLHYRTRHGFHLVRGSDAAPGGLKDHALMVLAGMTQGRIRGAIKALVEVDALEIIPTPKPAQGWRTNFLGKPRRPPALYRVADWFRTLLRKGPTDSDGSSRKPLFFKKPLTRKAQDFTNSSPITGEFTTKPVTPTTAKPLSGILSRALDRLGLAVLNPQPLPKPPAAPMPAPVLPKVFGPPRPSELDRKLGVWQGRVEDAPKRPATGYNEAEAAGAPDSDWWDGDDRRWAKLWPTQTKLSPALWPKLYDDDRDIRIEVFEWLEEYVGKSRWSMHAPQQRGVRPDLKRLTPLELHEHLGIDRDYRIGFRAVNDRFAFFFRWGGVAPEITNEW